MRNIVVSFVWLALNQNLALGQDAKAFTESIYLIPSECRIAVVELRGGTVNLDKGDLFSVVCSPDLKKDLTLTCSFFGEDKKPTSQNRKYSGGIIGAEAVISDEGDTFILNLTSQKFFSESTLNLRNGLVRGRKICGGSFLYESDLKKK